MKRFIILLLLLTTGISVWGQDPIYVIFSSTNADTDQASVWHHKNRDYNTALYRDTTHRFTIINRSSGYSYKFIYLNWIDGPDNPVIEKPLSFLSSVPCIDWDRIGPELNKQQAADRIRNILSHDKIYFIDRNDIKNGIAYLIPVKRMEPAF